MKNKFLSKEFLSKYFTMIVVWHMLILYNFTSPKHLTQDPKTKNPKCPGSGSSVFQNLQCPVDRPGRPTCTTVHVHISRPAVDRSKPFALWKTPVDRVGRPVSPNGRIFDRWRSTDPVDRTLSKVLTDPTALFSDSFSFGICFQRISWGVFDPYK